MQKICHAIPTCIVLNIYVVFTSVWEHLGTNFARCAHLLFAVESLAAEGLRSPLVLGYGPTH